MDSIDNELAGFSIPLIQGITRTYAHTWVPVSGMIVKRTASSSRRTHATFPSEEREAVSSIKLVSELHSPRTSKQTRKCLNITDWSFEAHLERMLITLEGRSDRRGPLLVSSILPPRTRNTLHRLQHETSGFPLQTSIHPIQRDDLDLFSLNLSSIFLYFFHHLYSLCCLHYFHFMWMLIMWPVPDQASVDCCQPMLVNNWGMQPQRRWQQVFYYKFIITTHTQCKF